VVINLAALLREAGRDIRSEAVMAYGVGSIGLGALRLMLDVMPHPAELQLCDPFRDAEFFDGLEATLRREHGFRGSIRIVRGGDPIEAGVIVGATNVGDVLDVDRLPPDTLIVDDSAPHCLNAEAALARFAARRDILFTEGGFVCARDVMPRIAYVPPALTAVLPADIPQQLYAMLSPRDITACILSALFSARRPDLPPTVGLVDADAARLHWHALQEAGFAASVPNYEGVLLDPEGIATFRARKPQHAPPTCEPA
jgi:hypothetical protein